MAINFNGTSQWGDMAGVLFSSDAAYTLVAYVKCDNTTTTEQHIVGGYGTGTNTRQSAFVYRADATPKSLAKKKTNGTAYYGTAAASFVPVQGSWNTLIEVRNSTLPSAGASRLMLNNGTVDVTAQAENGAVDLNRFSVGAYKLGTGSGATVSSFFKGSIAALAVYSRAINTTEEGQLKAPTRPTVVSTTNLVEYWEFSGSGTATTSTGINGSTITWFNAPTLDSDLPFSGITSIGSGGNVTMGVSNPIVTIGLGTLTSLTLATVGAGSYAVSTLNAPSGTGSFTPQLWVDNTVAPYFGTVTATTTDGITPTSTTTNFVIPSGYAQQTFAGALTSNPTYLNYYFNNLGTPLVDADKVYYPTANNFSITPQGAIEVTGAQTISIVIHKTSTFKTFYYNVVITENNQLLSVTRAIPLFIGIGIGI